MFYDKLMTFLQGQSINVYPEMRNVPNRGLIVSECMTCIRIRYPGNHRDAWSFGAVDPNSGTAALLEVNTYPTNRRVYKLS